jgi:signal transduction histidine kinase/ligand-binding sensor domain-containing protein/DNA-binding response OmpR family regulator
MYKNITMGWVFLLVSLVSGKAQTGSFFSTDADLSNSLINSIYQDSRNYIWIATEDGLNKYDGVRFTIYRNKKNDTGTLKNNYVRTVYEDSKGRIWVGCINGLLVYDRSLDSFTEIPIYFRKQVIEPHITSIVELNSGELVVATSGGGVIRPANDYKSFLVDEGLFPQLSSRYLMDIHQDKAGNIWIASENQGLNCLVQKTGEILTFKAPATIGSNQISAIAEDKYGNIYVGTLTGGLFKYLPGEKRFRSIPYRNASIVLPVKSLLYDEVKDQLLVGTDGRGLMYYDQRLQQLTEYEMLSAVFDFSRTKVHALYQDKTGNLWVGLFQKGVFIAPNHPNKFQYWGAKSFYNNVIGSNCVMSVLKDNDGTLWVGTDNDGVYAVDRSRSSRHYEMKTSYNGVSGTIMSMVEGDASTLWMASFLDGLIRFDKRSGSLQFLKNELKGNHNNTSSNKATSLAKDALGRIWVGTNGAGVSVFDPELNRFTQQFLFHEEDSSGIANNWVNTLMSDGDSLIWIGTYGGASSVDVRTGKINTYRTKNGILPGNIVYAIARDSNRKLWFGTTEGLSGYDEVSAKAEHFTIDDGLPGNVICGIVDDEKGSLWISTHTGISRYLLNEKRFINHYSFDGLQGNEFSMGAAYKARDGELIFGGIGGVSAFYPSKIIDQRAPLHIFLTGLNVLDRPVVSNQKSGRFTIIDRFIMDVEKIKLNHNDNMFSLEFSTFEFTAPERVYYKYKLEGLNDQWITNEQGNNRISFTNLSYGTYKLRVKASIRDNESAERLLTIVIYPPWYLSMVARFVYFLLFVLLMWGVYRYITERIRYRHEMIRREHLEQVNEGKLQFFINISHEIRTPMTLIISPLEKLISENTNAARQQVYLLMYRNAQRIVRLINQLLDIRKIDKGLMFVKMRETDLVGFIDDIITTFEYQAKKKNVNLSFHHEMPELKVWIDMNNFDKVLVNILSNAFKFTPENGTISIELSTGNQQNVQGALRTYFQIIVSDTGVGLEEDKVEKIFERFYQIDHQQQDVNFGTGIGLHLSRNLVELMHGIIFARNRHDTPGSEFIIQMPLGSEHLSELEMESGSGRQSSRQQLPASELLQDDDYSQPAVTKGSPKTRYKLLIVEDENEIRQYLRSELSGIYKISEATNGKQALEMILNDKPDMVVSDVMMPEMDGVTLCKKLKSNININHIPIILLTARSSDEDKAEGFDIGADAYVAKPFNVELLKKRIANILENRERLGMKLAGNDEQKALIKPVILKSSDQILIEKVTRIINENMDNPELNVEMLADGVGMSRVHMHRKLKELTNQSARDFIRTIRLQQASTLLTTQKLTVSEVAYALGFSNLSHFSNSFREFYGISPKEYAEKNKKV